MCFKCTPTQPDNHCHHKEGKWSKSDLNRDRCTSCKKLGSFNIFVASLQEADSFVDEAIMQLWSTALSPRLCNIFFNHWLKYSKFKFFMKKMGNQRMRSTPTQLCSKCCRLQDQRTQYVFIYNFVMLKTWLWKAKSL